MNDSVRIGKYELARCLGGAMAEVFLARTISVEGFAPPVAIKCVLPSYCANCQSVALKAGRGDS